MPWSFLFFVSLLFHLVFFVRFYLFYVKFDIGRYDLAFSNRDYVLTEFSNSISVEHLKKQLKSISKSFCIYCLKKRVSFDIISALDDDTIGDETTTTSVHNQFFRATECFSFSCLTKHVLQGSAKEWFLGCVKRETMGRDSRNLGTII